MKHRRGFTLVELNLAMVFIAILLIGVAMTTIHITRIYQKGSTIKTINQIGREVNDQLRRDISAAIPSKVTMVTSGQSGRLCLGNVTYVYNTPAALASTSNKITIDGDSSRPIYLARVIDGSAEWCSDLSKNRIDSSTEEYAELLTNDVIPLAVHMLNVTEHRPAGSVTQELYELDMQLGTNEAGTIDGDRCRPPSESTSNFEYCFIAEFNTVIRAGEISSGV